MTETDDHLRPLRLFDIARNGGPGMSDQEREHLNECEDCRSEIEIFIREFAAHEFAAPRSKEEII